MDTIQRLILRKLIKIDTLLTSLFKDKQGEEGYAYCMRLQVRKRWKKLDEDGAAAIALLDDNEELVQPHKRGYNVLDRM